MSLYNNIIDIKQPIKLFGGWWSVQYKESNNWEKKFFTDVARAYEFYTNLHKQILKHTQTIER